jgi:hypothetical protein
MACEARQGLKQPLAPFLLYASLVAKWPVKPVRD